MSINKEEFDNLRNSVRRIERAICGDDEMGVTGLAKDVADLKKWRNKVSLKLAFITGAAVTIWELGKGLLEHFTNYKL